MSIGKIWILEGLVSTHCKSQTVYPSQTRQLTKFWPKKFDEISKVRSLCGHRDHLVRGELLGRHLSWSVHQVSVLLKHFFSLSLKVWAKYYKTFYVRNLVMSEIARVFVLGKPFQPSLMVVSKACSLP